MLFCQQFASQKLQLITPPKTTKKELFEPFSLVNNKFAPDYNTSDVVRLFALPAAGRLLATFLVRCMLQLSR
jgi:hypothetical protein